MKVLWLSHLVPYPPKGGALQRSYYLLREAAKYHEIYLVAFIQQALLQNCFDSVAKGLETSKRALSEFCASTRFIPIPCEQYRAGKNWLLLKSLFTADPYTINWLKSREMHHAIEELVERVPIDVVHFDTISLAPYLRHFPHQRKILNHHNIESHMMLRRARNETAFLKKLYLCQEGLRLRRYERRICSRFSLNVTCSELDSERLREVVSPITVEEVSNGVDLQFFAENTEEENPNSLVFAGRLDAYPNRRAALFIAEKLWPLLKREIPNVSFDLVGANPPREAIELSRTDRSFRVHGFVDDVRPYLGRAAVYVCPITDGGGTKLKILDALAMKKAVVADPIACEGIDVVNGESVLFALRPEEYVSSIKRLLKDVEKRQMMGERGRQLVANKYAYPKLGRKLAQALKGGEVPNAPDS
jgi:glycosyltransferase involved in cell wall biosynthesis